MPKLLDANALLRYLLNDNQEQAVIVRNAVPEGAFTVPEVLCEVVYVLQGRVYKFERSEIASALLGLLEDIDCDRLVCMRAALKLYCSTTLDFVDCILISMNNVLGHDVLTFDKKMNRLMKEN